MNKKRFGCVMMLLCVLFSLALAEEKKPLVARPLPWDRTYGTVPKKEKYDGQTRYEDDSIRVEITKTTAYESTCFVAKVEIGDASQLRSETAAESFKYRRTVPGHRLAQKARAVIAINGDFYSYMNDGYMVRQGEEYRDFPDVNRDILLIDKDGNFHIVPNATREKIEAYKEKTIVNSFNFGPGLVIDGKLGENMRNYNNGAMFYRQRVAIGQSDEKTYYLFVTEGRSDGSRGMTLLEFRDFVSQYPVKNCYNLDGGNSAHLIFNNERINAVGFRDVRDINDILYFASTEE